MDAEKIFAFLQKQKKADLLDYLRGAFGVMDTDQRYQVFGHLLRPKPAKGRIHGEPLWQQLDAFRRDSLARRYYAPFNMNSKNWQHIPEKTREWCDLFARFARDAIRLTAQGDHADPVRCFAVLWEVKEAFDRGEEIVFAEEVGEWLIPAQAEEWLTAYATSLAATATPAAFTAAALLILENYRHSGNREGLTDAFVQAATSEQKAHLLTELNKPTR